MKKISSLLLCLFGLCLCLSGCASTKVSYPCLGSWLIFEQEDESGVIVDMTMDFADDSTYTVSFMLDYTDEAIEQTGMSREAFAKVVYNMTEINIGELTPLMKGKYSYRDSVIKLESCSMEEGRFSDLIASVLCGDADMLATQLNGSEMTYNDARDVLIENENIYQRYE